MVYLGTQETQFASQQGVVSKITKIIAGTWQTLSTVLERRRQHVEQRNAYRHLLTLDDATLRDIGVTRYDVEIMDRLPIHENAALHLRELKRQW